MTRHVSVSIMFASGRPSQQPASKVHAGVCWPRGADADSLSPPLRLSTGLHSQQKSFLDD